MARFCTRSLITALLVIPVMLFGIVPGAFQSGSECRQGGGAFFLAQAQAQQRQDGGKEAQEQPSKPQPRYLGNAYNHTFHVPGCRYYGCRDCTTRAFDTREEAIKAGYRPCKLCQP